MSTVAAYLARWVPPPAILRFADDAPVIRAIQSGIPYYYGGLLFAAILELVRFRDLFEIAAIYPIWPNAWVSLVGPAAGIRILFLLLIIGAFLAALFPARRWTRLLAWFGVLQLAAFVNSINYPTLIWHAWLLTATILVFLPDNGEASGGTLYRRMQTITVFWACQAIILATYSLTGLGKLVEAVVQFAAGQPTLFAPEALAYHAAQEMLKVNVPSLLGHWVIEHPWAGWPLLVPAVLFTTSAIAAAFRPGLQRVWGIGLIVFHVGVYLVTGIAFFEPIFPLFVFLIHSPFRSGRSHVRQHGERTLQT